jgi:hypothetical protein
LGQLVAEQASVAMRTADAIILVVAPDLGRNVFPCKAGAILVGVVADRQLDIGGKGTDSIRILGIDPGPQHRKCHDPVHRAGIQIPCAQ